MNVPSGAFIFPVWVVATWNCQVQVWLEGRERCGLVITPACRATELKVN